MTRRLTYLALSMALTCVIGSALPASARSTPSSPLTLTVWSWADFPPGLAAFQQLDREFTKQHPNVKIREVAIPYGSYWPKLRTAIAAHTGPDIVMPMPGVESADYRAGLLPLDHYITADQRRTIALLSSSAAPDGHTYALPYGSYVYVFYYNKALFRKAGLNPAAPPETWPAFLKACKALKAAGTVPISAGFKDGYELEWYIYPLSDQTLTKAQFNQWNRYNLPLTASPMRESFTYFKQLVTRGYMTPHAEGVALYNDAYTNFNNGKAAMVLDTGNLGNIQNAEKLLGARNVGVMMFPRVSDSHWPPFLDMGPNSGYGITRWSAHPADAYAYLSYLEGVHGQSVLWKTAAQLPNNPLVTAQSSDPIMRQILTWTKNPANHTTFMGFPLPVLGIFEKFAGEVYTGQTSVDDLLQQSEQVRQGLASHVR